MGLTLSALLGFERGARDHLAFSTGGGPLSCVWPSEGGFYGFAGVSPVRWELPRTGYGNQNLASTWLTPYTVLWTNLHWCAGVSSPGQAELQQLIVREHDSSSRGPSASCLRPVIADQGWLWPAWLSGTRYGYVLRMRLLLHVNK